MTPLATPEDVSARLGRDLSATENARIDALLADASGAVRRYVPQDFTHAISTTRLQVRNGTVKLPQRPVLAVTAVTSTLGDPVLFTWDGFDSIRTSPNVPEHGYVPIPDDVIGVVCSIVMRALGRNPVDAGITSESIAGYSYSLGSAAAAGALGMLQAEKDILDAFKREGTSARQDR
jgi:hypothetical protein